MKLRCALFPVLATFAHVLCVSPTAAQTTAKGFALDRFEPSERGSDWFSAESLDLRGNLRFAGGLVLDYSHDPLVLYQPDGTKLSGIVSDQFFAHLGGSLIVDDRVRFALNLPVAIAQGGEAGSANTLRVASKNSTTIGDLRLGVDARLFGQYGDPATVAVGVQFFAPTGSQASFTSDGSVRFMPRALFAGEIAPSGAPPITYSLGLGFLYRANRDSFVGDPRGDEMNVQAAAGVRLLDRRLVVGPELFGSSIVSKADAFFGRHATPFELIFGGHYALAPEWRVGAGVGPGLTRAPGTPTIRGLLSVEWVQALSVPPPPPPPPQPADRDGDKVMDPEDACPDDPGVRTDDPKTNGCPPPPDRDKDGILDSVDACPDDAGEASDDPNANGCPDRDHDKIIDKADACPEVAGIKTDDPKTNGCPDRDKDGIVDDADACPDEAGEPNTDPKKNGCPPSKDRDEDGILNEQDACPDAAGPANKDPKKNGCPVARVEKGQIRIREQVQFAFNSAQILKASDFILDAVAKILKDNPEVQVRVEGHTDNKGSADWNKKLSTKRAESVMAWLVKHGIDKARLTSAGYGKDRPIDTNDTDEGRANNRRVEFHILGQEAAEAAP